ncbi:MAG: type II secretion system protein M [Butyrivibrio sp.]|uniref:type II secretion system protein GspM n=1 Tax=Butyrivibrio sp. TaxID=28121 RepID=UPI001EB3371E|nr:type II secretion system protein GspM [Butyrivibrio sp.]MBE5841652.1 type II secretion system protein M [Butyrivibrio sp.]
MKTFGREFTVREKVLLLVMVIIMLGALYYLMVFEPVTSEIHQAELAKQSLQDELLIAESRAAQIVNMRNEMEASEQAGRSFTYMPSYNASNIEIDYLHDVLETNADDYLINFNQITRSGNQIRRHFSLSFTARSYEVAKKIISELEASEIRCLIGDISVSSSEESVIDGDVGISCVATFYETMYDAVEDSELPEDSAQSSQAADDTGE